MFIYYCYLLASLDKRIEALIRLLTKKITVGLTVGSYFFKVLIKEHVFKFMTGFTVGMLLRKFHFIGICLKPRPCLELFL